MAIEPSIPPGRTSRLFRLLARFGRRHRRPFLIASVAATVWIGLRLALPWLGSRVLIPWLADQAGARASHRLAFQPLGGIDSPLVVGALFVVACIGLGLADYLMRLHYTRFSIGLARDLRAAAFASAVEVGRAGRGKRKPADLGSRLVSDVNRIKGGLKTVLIHLAPNAILFAGVSVVLCSIDAAMGAVFAAAFVVVAGGAFLGARSMFRRAFSLRAKESRLVHAIERAFDGGKTDRAARKVRQAGATEASLTRQQVRSTWWAYTVFGVAVAASAWLGLREVEAGRLAGAHMITFTLYALMMRTPFVQLARQGARTGKILASAERVAELLELRPSPPRPGHEGARRAIPPAPASVGLRLAELELHAPKRLGRRHLLGPLDLQIASGQKILIAGESGAGKSLLCELLAGLREPSAGQLDWGATGSGDASPGTGTIAHQGPDTAWPRQPIRDLLGLGKDTPPGPAATLLEATGAAAVIARFPGGLDCAVASSELAAGERAALVLARTLLMPASAYVLDDPAAGLDRAAARKLMHSILQAKPDATVVVASNAPAAADRFDRVIELWRGRIVFDGPPQSWNTASSRGDSRVLWN